MSSLPCSIFMDSLVHGQVLDDFPMGHCAPSPTAVEILQHRLITSILAISRDTEGRNRLIHFYALLSSLPLPFGHGESCTWTCCNVWLRNIWDIANACHGAMVDFWNFCWCSFFVILNSFEFKTQRMRRRNRPWRHDKALAMSHIFRNQMLEHVDTQDTP